MKTIEVPCNLKKAFTVFMDMGSWWPTNKVATSVMRGQTVKALRVDAKEGGRIVEVGSDGNEQLWGTIKTYDPYRYVNMDFHIPHPTEKNPGFSTSKSASPLWATTGPASSSSRATGKRSATSPRWSKAATARAWVMIFEGAYKAACGG